MPWEAWNMIHVQVSEQERRELEQVSRQAVGRVALRAQMVLLSARGYRVPQIAAIHHCGPEVVRLWLHRYAQAGVAGLDDAPRSGRPPKDGLAGQIIDTQASQSPECSGHVQSCWTVALLTAYLTSRFQLVLARHSVRRYLHRMGGRWARPRLAPAQQRRPDPLATERRAALAAARAAAAHGEAHLVYVDERELHLLPLIRAMGLKGRRVRVPTPGQKAKHAFFGALDVESGQWFWTDHPRKLAVHFVAFLEPMAAAYPRGRLYIAMDGAPAHTAKVVQRWAAAHPHVTLLRLPPYAAHDENPVERIWGLLKDAVAANRLAGSMDALVRAAVRFFKEMTAPTEHPVFLPLAA
jgi:transposase